MTTPLNLYCKYFPIILSQNFVLYIKKVWRIFGSALKQQQAPINQIKEIAMRPLWIMMINAELQTSEHMRMRPKWNRKWRRTCLHWRKFIRKKVATEKRGRKLTFFPHVWVTEKWKINQCFQPNPQFQPPTYSLSLSLSLPSNRVCTLYYTHSSLWSSSHHL